MFPIKIKWRYKMYLTAFIVNLLYVSTGCVLAWPSPVLPMLKELGYTDEQNSWIASVMALGAVLGSLTIGVISSRLGRRATLFLNGGLFALSWLIVYSPSHFVVLLMGRFLAGYALSMTFNVIPAYLTEIAQDDVRQAMTSPVEFFIGIGFVFQSFFGSFLDYHELQVASLIVVVTFLVAATLVPESPFYLVSKERHQQTKDVLSWLWNKHDNLDEEVVKIQNILSTNQTKDGTVKKIDLVRKKGYRRAFLTVLLIVSAQQFTAITVIESYFLSLLDMTGMPFPLYRATTALAATFAVTSCAAPPLVRYFGTKTVFVASTFIIAVCQGILGVYMLLKRFDYALEPYYLVPLSTFAIYFAALAIGAGPLPWSIMAELSPAEHSSFITCICSTSTWLLCVLLLRFFSPSIEAFGADSIFFFFSATLTLTGVVVVLILPDTKSMSLLQVKQNVLDDKKLDNVEDNASSKGNSEPEKS